MVEKTGVSWSAHELRICPGMPSELHVFLGCTPLKTLLGNSQCAYLPSRIAIHAVLGACGGGISPKT